MGNYQANKELEAPYIMASSSKHMQQRTKLVTCGRVLVQGDVQAMRCGSSVLDFGDERGDEGGVIPASIARPPSSFARPFRDRDVEGDFQLLV